MAEGVITLLPGALGLMGAYTPPPGTVGYRSPLPGILGMMGVEAVTPAPATDTPWFAGFVYGNLNRGR